MQYEPRGVCLGLHAAHVPKLDEVDGTVLRDGVHDNGKKLRREVERLVSRED